MRIRERKNRGEGGFFGPSPERGGGLLGERREPKGQGDGGGGGEEAGDSRDAIRGATVAEPGAGGLIGRGFAAGGRGVHGKGGAMVKRGLAAKVERDDREGG